MWGQPEVVGPTYFYLELGAGKATGVELFSVTGGAMLMVVSLFTRKRMITKEMMVVSSFVSNPRMAPRFSCRVMVVCL